jgi:hypothetical protein
VRGTSLIFVLIGNPLLAAEDGPIPAAAGGMAIHTLNWLSSCAETIRSHAAVCKAITTPPVSHQAASKRVERSSASQARKARTVLVLLLDAQGECLLRRRTARKGGVEWDVFGAAVQEGQTLSEAAFCELFAALPQLAEVPGRQAVPTLQHSSLHFVGFESLTIIILSVLKCQLTCTLSAWHRSRITCCGAGGGR